MNENKTLHVEKALKHLDEVFWEKGIEPVSIRSLLEDLYDAGYEEGWSDRDNVSKEYSYGRASKSS